MQFPSKPLVALGLLGSLASSYPVLIPSFTTSTISGTSPVPLATGNATCHATQHVSHLGTRHASHKDKHHGKDDSIDSFDHFHDFVDHTENTGVLAVQQKLAKGLVPVSYFCTGHEYCEEDTHGKKFVTGNLGKALKNVTVSMEQVKSSPLTIEVKITNNSTGPITFWKDQSPISPFAHELGYFDIKSEIHGVVFGERTFPKTRGYRPDRRSDLVELGPGEWASANIELPLFPDTAEGKTWRKMLEMGGNSAVRMYGSWYGVWAATKGMVMESDMDFSGDGFNFWNNLYIPWEAKFPEESKNYLSGMGFGMGLELE
ncbi:hypothetical protein NW756_006398 [Fusarium oxysporum]|nr:hypothetical protein NW753_008181 [Fusarium oxysporum]KAJ4049760.1 hypothetical protein NW763_009065 [Fusarium oxysporum]KAJ4090055.1 hypothetical protein NW756_006398 [Fusarium oxysporum]KAJ4112955.1 hypothetical protein NW769_005979 [Fusarium oxysporum]KAJ4235246.1 hypothetical protein NW760_004780 [Fusarium oxysporum]